MSDGSQRVRCDGGVCRCAGSRGMLNVSLHLLSLFSLGFMFKGISPENPRSSTKTTSLCVGVCMCVTASVFKWISGHVGVFWTSESPQDRKMKFSHTMGIPLFLLMYKI